MVVLSEYGITGVNRPVDLGRVLRRAGYLEVHTQDGMEYLDPTASRAFAVADHQLAPVYVRRPEDIAGVRQALENVEGVARPLGGEGKKAHGLDHPHSGEPVALADPDSGSPATTGWTAPAPRTLRSPWRPTASPATTPPSCSRTRSPRTSKCGRRVRWPARSWACATGWRWSRRIRPPVRGSHGRLPERLEHGPVLLCSRPGEVSGTLAATEVKSLLLRLAGLT